MRAFWEAIEAGAPAISIADLEAKLAPPDLAALRANGLLRDDGRQGYEEISLPDLGRALRTLYAAQGRGLTLPVTFHAPPTCLGWAPHRDGERQVSLYHGPKMPLLLLPFLTVPTLVLVPTGRHLTPAERERHGPDALAEVEILEEVLSWRDGRLARGFATAPPPADLSVPSLPSARASSLLRGAPRWNAIVVSRVDDETVHVDFPGVSVECSHGDLGMTHARSGRPRRVFELLVALCDGHGVFLSRRFGTPDATKKLVSRLGKELSDLFGLPETPFHPYRRKEGWQAKFIASPSLRGSV
jgi:hypothetical protein